jgi:predicted ArsR family transcriptional regulator
MFEGLEGATTAMAVLAEPSRRRMYVYIRAAGHPVSREEAAAHVGISRKLAAFHLDRLLEAGLLVAGQVRPNPGQRRPRGRAPKAYQPSRLEVEVSIPERRYELAGALFVDAIRGCRHDETPSDAATRVARERGLEFGRAARSAGRTVPRADVAELAMSVLERYGFEPLRVTDGSVILRSCPFAALARRAPDLVCAMNEALVDGVLRGSRDRAGAATLDPGPDRCCVRIQRRAGAAR